MREMDKAEWSRGKQESSKEKQICTATEPLEPGESDTGTHRLLRESGDVSQCGSR